MAKKRRRKKEKKKKPRIYYKPDSTYDSLVIPEALFSSRYPRGRKLKKNRNKSSQVFLLLHETACSFHKPLLPLTFGAVSQTEIASGVGFALCRFIPLMQSPNAYQLYSWKSTRNIKGSFQSRGSDLSPEEDDTDWRKEMAGCRNKCLILHPLFASSG